MSVKDLNIVLCITGGIAAYKAVSLASFLKKHDAEIYSVMTENATNFITPITLKSITGKKVTTTMFDDSDFIPHISLSDLADIILVAPATANIIAKAAHGIADDMTSTLLLSSKAHKIIIPAMNTNMYLNPITQSNIRKLRGFGFAIMEPEVGLMACGTSGPGRFPAIERIYEFIINTINPKPPVFKGKKVLITLGGTVEDIDPVRFITNRSSGKMGFNFAEEFFKRGADLTIIKGNVTSTLFDSFKYRNPDTKIIEVRSASDMQQAVLSRKDDFDIYMMAAAVADYKPVYSDDKIKKNDDDLVLKLTRNEDILKSLPKRSDARYIGFAAETSDLLTNAKKKLDVKGLDYLIANKVKGEKSAIGTDNAEVYLFSKQWDEPKHFEYTSKDVITTLIIDALIEDKGLL